MTDAIEADLAHPDQHQRLDALGSLLRERTQPARRGTNCHVHTDHSFGVFRSATEAVWHAVQAGVEIYGINDFFTTAGHAEFAAACAAAQLPAVFSLECIAMDRGLEAQRVLLNDPANPGKIYLCGKGVSQPDEPTAAKELARIRGYQEQRNRALVANAQARFRATVAADGPTWAEVVGQTPAGNTTERHVARAIQRRIQALASEGRAFAEVYAAVVGEPPKERDADQQNQIRSALLKAGKPCYAPEDPHAFPDVAGLHALFLRLGAIPTYPVLGDPITDGERDVPALFDRIAGWGFHAVELIPSRNSEARLAAVVAEAQRRGWPVFDGTEHNTPAMEPLLTTWGLDERFRPRFREGALVLLGHQSLRRKGAPGYLDPSGQPRANGYAMCLAEGQRAYDACRKRTLAG